MLDGKRIAFHTQQAALQGCWAEYVVVPVADCVPIDGDVAFEVRHPPAPRAQPDARPRHRATGVRLIQCSDSQDAAGALAAPMTAMAMLDLAQEFNHTAAVVSAGASTVAKLFLELCRDAGIAVVCIVRRPEDASDVVAMVRGVADSLGACRHSSHPARPRARVVRCARAVAHWQGAADVVDMSLPDYPARCGAPTGMPLSAPADRGATAHARVAAWPPPPRAPRPPSRSTPSRGR